MRFGWVPCGAGQLIGDFGCGQSTTPGDVAFRVESALLGAIRVRSPFAYVLRLGTRWSSDWPTPLAALRRPTLLHLYGEGDAFFCHTVARIPGKLGPRSPSPLKRRVPGWPDFGPLLTPGEGRPW